MVVRLGLNFQLVYLLLQLLDLTLVNLLLLLEVVLEVVLVVNIQLLKFCLFLLKPISDFLLLFFVEQLERFDVFCSFFLHRIQLSLVLGFEVFYRLLQGFHLEGVLLSYRIGQS